MTYANASNRLLEQRQQQQRQYAAEERRYQSLSWWFGVLRLVLFAFAAFASMQMFRSDPLWLPRAVLPTSVVFVLVVLVHRRVQFRRETARRRKLLAGESAQRLQRSNGPGASTTLPEAAVSALDDGTARFHEVEEHVLHEWVVEDLGVEGPTSLLQVLNTTQSTLGARRLRRLLRAPLSQVEAIHARQEAVQQLAKNDALRDALMLAYFEGRSTPMRRLPGFLAQPRGLPGGAPRWIAAGSALLTLPLVLLGIQQPILLPFAALALTPGLLVRVRVRHQVAALRESWLELGPILHMVERVSAGLAAAQPSSAVLQKHAVALRDGGIKGRGFRLRALRRLITLLRLHEIGFLYGIIDFLLQWDLHWLFALEAEAGARRDELEGLTAGLVELESLLALAVWSAEQDGCSVPEIVAHPTPLLHIEAGEHPLLRRGVAVANDLQLGDGTRVELVTGSNMAGKSTFLRMVMLNALLAQVGAPVRARALRMTPLQLQANINVRDSLADGKSYFLVEVERVKDILDVASVSPFVLTVFDELFRGTNSNERLAASREIARSLAAQGGLCLLATHDLELTRLVREEAVEGIAALHFRDEIEDGRMVFPYVAHRGVSGVHNALRLLELSGYPAELVERAQEFARTSMPDQAPASGAPAEHKETPRAPDPEGS